MNSANEKYTVVVASDVDSRDGIGIEIYQDDKLLLEIFRDDGQKKREITLYCDTFILNEMEKFIQIFKEKIPWDFVN